MYIITECLLCCRVSLSTNTNYSCICSPQSPLQLHGDPGNQLRGTRSSHRAPEPARAPTIYIATSPCLSSSCSNLNTGQLPWGWGVHRNRSRSCPLQRAGGRESSAAGRGVQAVRCCCRASPCAWKRAVAPRGAAAGLQLAQSHPFWCGVLSLTSELGGQGAVLCAPLPLIPRWPWAWRSRWEQAASMPRGPRQPQEQGRATAAPQIAAAGWVWDRWILVPVRDWAAVPTASSAGSCQCMAQRSWAAREGAAARTRAGGGRKGSACSQPWKAFLGGARKILYYYTEE